MPSSPNLSRPADARPTLLAAVAEVAERSLFAFADPADLAGFEERVGHLGRDEPWLTSHVVFAGPASGQFALSLPAPCARTFAAAFAGRESVDEIRDGEMYDFAGELANMVCGAWLTATDPGTRFTLTPPQVEREDAACALPSESPDLALVVHATIDDAPVRMVIRWIDAGAESPLVAAGTGAGDVA